MTTDIKNILKTAKKIHFVGIGGISMSALSRIMKKNGFEVSGSDISESEEVCKLRNLGIPVVIGHNAENVESADLVVYTAAVKADNPELIRAKEKGIFCAERAVLLGAVMDSYNFPIGICGTHGKTTVTSMISSILIKASANPTITVGGEFDLIKGNLLLGDNNHFIFEACEYCNSFLSFHPFISVFLNIEEDHLDFFKDIDDIISSFAKYAKNTKTGGYIIANADDDNIKKALSEYDGKILTFGLSGDVSIKNLRYKQGYPHFELHYDGKLFTDIALSVPGAHNVYNAAAAAAAAISLGYTADVIKPALQEFKGTRRRFELRHRIDGITIVDDYAHHPSEIAATLTAAKSMGYGRVICCFQPHTYTRTKALLNDFSVMLSIADKVFIEKIYPAREKDIYGVSGKDLANLIEGAEYFADFESLTARVSEYAKEGDLIITMGAGDITKAADLIKNTLLKK